MKIRVGDTVKIMSGKKIDKNKVAKVLKVLKSENKILVEGVGIVTKHEKKTAAAPGKIVKKEKAVDASSVMLMCPIMNKPTRVGYTISAEGKKFRYSKIAVKEQGKKEIECIIK